MQNPMTEEAERRKRQSQQTRCSSLVTEMVPTEGHTAEDHVEGDNSYLLLLGLVALAVVVGLLFWMARRGKNAPIVIRVVNRDRPSGSRTYIHRDPWIPTETPRGSVPFTGPEFRRASTMSTTKAGDQGSFGARTTRGVAASYFF
jgi:hypothetical protein